MRVNTLRVRNFRSFTDSGRIALAPINVLVGANNAGKSSLLRALHAIQRGGLPVGPDVRVGSTSCEIEIALSDVVEIPNWQAGNRPVTVTHKIILSAPERKGGGSIDWRIVSNGAGLSGGRYELSNVDPHHFVVPYFSRRKTAGYSEDVREHAAMTISIDMSNLAAKLTRIGNPYFPNHDQYASTCHDILGFVVTSIPSTNGQRPGVYLPNREAIDIDFMGEGVPNIVQLLVNLATSENKLFLIEEPENDIHPSALKALLDLIVVSSQKNQFVISTHSNIVVSHLCANENSKLWRVSSPKGRLPYESTVAEVERTVGARQQVLADLGYALSDFGFWSGYIILEESSAEFIIRNYLIPLFAPSLKRIRTISAGGIGNVEPTFADLSRLALFMHLEPTYANRAWVLVDGDDVGRETVRRLRERFKSWHADRFRAFALPQFEHYYPGAFENEVRSVLAIEAPDRRRLAKTHLLQRVIAWLDEDPDRAKSALERSAAEVVQQLRSIEAELAAAPAT